MIVLHSLVMLYFQLEHSVMFMLKPNSIVNTPTHTNTHHPYRFNENGFDFASMVTIPYILQYAYTIEYKIVYNNNINKSTEWFNVCVCVCVCVCAPFLLV